MSSWAVNVRSGSTIARLPCNQRGSMGLSQGLFTGSRHTRIRTPPVRFTVRLCAPIHARTARLTCQAALSHTSTHTRLPSAPSRAAPQARKAGVTRLTGRPAGQSPAAPDPDRCATARSRPEPWAGHRPSPALWRAAAASRPRRAGPAGPGGSTRPRRHSPPPSRGGEPPSRSGGRASFFERLLRVRAGDPGLRPPPADPQPLERVADGLITDPLGRDPVLGADLGGQGQGPGGAALPNWRGLWCKSAFSCRLRSASKTLAAVCGRRDCMVTTASPRLPKARTTLAPPRAPGPLEGSQDVAHRLRTAPDGLGDHGGGVAAGGGQEDVAAAHREPVRRTQSRPQGVAFRVAPLTNKEGLHPSADAIRPPAKQSPLNLH